MEKVNSPAYQCAAYQRMAPLWRFLDNVYQGDHAWIDYQPDGALKATPRSRLYLPQEPGEEDPDYSYRLSTSTFNDKFAQAVRDFVGLVFNNGIRLVGVPPPILEAWPNLDGMGMAGNRFLAQQALAALRRGHSFILVDYPALDESISSLADLPGWGRSPFWTEVSPLQVLNWRWQYVGNRQHLTQVTIAVDREEPDGAFGEATRRYYLVLTPGQWQKWTLVQDSQGKEQPVLLCAGVMGRKVRGRVQPFQHIPLVCLYGGDRSGFFKSNPTLFTLAKLNVAHYQTKSDHRQKMHRCCFPQAVRTGGDGSDLVLGPKTIVDVPIGGAFGWAEPQAQSLRESRQECLDMESEMNFLGADYLTKPGDRQAAATTEVQAAKLESELYLFASDFAQGVTEALAMHAAYLGLESGGRVELNTSFFERSGHDPQLLNIFHQMRQTNDLSRAEFRRLAQHREFVPRDFEFDQENTHGSITVG